jgi:glycerophosphoryl diester phosphodiesterase
VFELSESGDFFVGKVLVKFQEDQLLLFFGWICQVQVVHPVDRIAEQPLGTDVFPAFSTDWREYRLPGSCLLVTNPLKRNLKIMSSKNSISVFRLLFVLTFCLSAQLIYAQERVVQLFAHRGGAHEFDENTIEAFKASYEKGLRGFETDVRITKDGVFVISHDASLERTNGSKGIVEEMTAAELRKVKTKKGNSFLFLDDLLAYFSDKPSIYFEFEMKTRPEDYPQEKLEPYCDLLYKTLMAKKPANALYVLTAFDKRPLKYLKGRYPDVELLFITSSALTPEVIKETQDLGIKRVGCRLGGTSRDLVRSAQKAGLIVSCWPGLSVSDFLLGVYLGCDYLCSDVPVEVLTWMKDKMPWVKIK